MIDRTFVQQIGFLNKLPINREATWWLKVASADQEYEAPDRLHVISLMLWALEERKVVFDPPQINDLLKGTLVAMSERNPKRVLDYLTNGPDGPEVEALHLKRSESPADAARKLLQHLDSTLRAENSLLGSYPPIYPTLT